MHTPAATQQPSATPRPGTSSSPDLLPGDLAMDAVTLRVRNLDQMLAYYHEALSLDVLARTIDTRTEAATPGEFIVLGRAGTATRPEVPIVALAHHPDLPPPNRGQAGLFHTAILYPDQAALAATLVRLASVAGSTFTGSADHLVSEAFYFDDPEGNGVELYVDRPRDQWQWEGSTVSMASLPLDPQSFVTQHADDSLIANPALAGAAVGHVHLQVGDIPQTHDFYVNTLGFEVTANMSSALFMSAGGYHHHIAANTWRSMGAGPRAVTLGLGEMSLALPSPDAVAAVRDRVAFRGVEVTDDGQTVSFDDPWRNRIKVSVAS